MAAEADFLIFDTPGRDDPFARHVATGADTLVTPLNDSFVDFDLIGQVDAETFKIRRLSFYAELIWEARKKRAMATIREQKREMDWVVVRNRTQHVEARNQKRLEGALTELSKRVGFRIANGLSERVIYRELFPSGLTLLDKGHLGELGTSHLVARQELRALLAGLNLPRIAQSAGRTGAGGCGSCPAVKVLWLLALATLACRMFTGRWPWELLGKPANPAEVPRPARCWGFPARPPHGEIIDAHRRLIAMVHPDKGGTNEQVHEANAARDLLLAALQDHR